MPRSCSRISIFLSIHCSSCLPYHLSTIISPIISLPSTKQHNCPINQFSIFGKVDILDVVKSQVKNNDTAVVFSHRRVVQDFTDLAQNLLYAEIQVVVLEFSNRLVASWKFIHPVVCSVALFECFPTQGTSLNELVKEITV